MQYLTQIRVQQRRLLLTAQVSDQKSYKALLVSKIRRRDALDSADRSELTEALRFSESSHGYLLSRASRLRILETWSAL